MTYRETARMMAVLQAAFPNFYSRAEDRDAAVKIWAAALDDLPYGEAQAAVMRVIRTSRFPPTVAEVRQAADDLRWEARDFVAQAALRVPVYAGIAERASSEKGEGTESAQLEKGGEK